MNTLNNFNGLSIVVDAKRRHDNNQLIGGYAGDKFFSGMLFPVRRRESTVRLLNSPNPYRDDAKVILALGEDCVEAFCNKKNLDLHSARGCPWTLEEPDGTSKIVVLSYHPQDAFDRKAFGRADKATDEVTGSEKDSQTTKRSNWAFWLKQDVAKVKRLLKGEHLQPFFPFEKCVRPDLYALGRELRTTRNATLYIDIETLPVDNTITCIGLSFNDGPVFVVPFMDYKHEWAYGKEVIAQFLGSLSIAFQRNKVVAHNGCFDFMILAWKYKVLLPKQPYDTMLAHHRMHPEVEKSLAHCGSLYTDQPYHKDEGIFDPKNREQQEALWHYNALDVWLMAQIQLRQEQVFKGYESSIEQACNLIRPCLVTTLTGLKLDVPELEVDLDRRLRWDKVYLKMLKAIAGGNFNPRSPKQVKAYYEEHLGLKALKSTDEASLLSVYNKTQAPSVKIILAARGNSKLRSAMIFNRWSCSVYGGADDRATTSYIIAGPDTFRLASRQLLSFKTHHGYGANMQNWKKECRRFIVPDKGKVLVQVDQAGAEAMMVAWLCEAGSFRELFKQGIKSHVYVAMHLFASHWAERLGVPDIDDYLHSPVNQLKSKPLWKQLEVLIKTDALKYYTGKTVCHASNYDMKAPTFQKQAMVKSNNELILTIKQCKEYLTTYHRLFPEIRGSYHLETQQELRRSRTLKNLFGFPRVFNDPFDDVLWKKGYAFRPQSTSGCLTHEVFIASQAKIESGEWEDVDLLQNGHDSILYQCKEDFALELAGQASKMFNVTFAGRDEPFTMKSEYGIGYNWMPWSEKKNPSGIKES